MVVGSVLGAGTTLGGNNVIEDLFDKYAEALRDSSKDRAKDLGLMNTNVSDPMATQFGIPSDAGRLTSDDVLVYSAREDHTYSWNNRSIGFPQ